MPRISLSAVAVIFVLAIGLFAVSRPDETPGVSRATAGPRYMAETPSPAPPLSVSSLSVEPIAKAGAPIGPIQMADSRLPGPSVLVTSRLPAKAASMLPGAHVVHMRVTAYCPCAICCGSQACGITASGKRVTVDHCRFVAADAALLSFGDRVVVPGYAHDRPVRVRDRGGAIVGNRLDVFFRTHHAAAAWGVRWLDVLVYDD